MGGVGTRWVGWVLLYGFSYLVQYKYCTHVYILRVIVDLCGLILKDSSVCVSVCLFVCLFVFFHQIFLLFLCVCVDLDE